MPFIPLITGIGLATPLGNSSPATWNSLCSGEFILDHSRVPGIEANGEPRVNILAKRVAREAIAEAGWNSEELHDAALIAGTSKGPVDEWLEPPNPMIAEGGSPGLDEQDPGLPPSAIIAPSGQGRLSRQGVQFGLAETASAVATEFGIHGPRLTLCAACASGLHALIRAAMMIRAGEVSRAVVVASESSLHPLFIASFSRLGVIPPRGHGCRPFDQTRAGFLIAEAAAAVCLEASESVQEGFRKPIAIERFAMGADATHLTAADPHGTMLRHLLNRLLSNGAPDLIHAHGTGTLTNDPIELAAIEASLKFPGESPPNLYSHKGALGHSLGAAGLAAIAINCLAHRHGIVPPNVQTRQPLKCATVAIDQRVCRRPINRSIAIAAGFGGALAGVALAGG